MNIANHLEEEKRKIKGLVHKACNSGAVRRCTYHRTLMHIFNQLNLRNSSKNKILKIQIQIPQNSNTKFQSKLKK